MLIKLEPGQVSRWWEAIRDTVRHGLPPTAVNDEERMANVLAALLSGRAQGWVLMQDEQIVGILVTMILVEEMTHSKVLLIYSFAGVAPVLRNTWQQGLHELQQFAKGTGCDKIGAFTTHKGIVQMLKSRVDGVTEQIYVDIPVVN